MTSAIEALKNLEPTQYQLAANIRDMLSSLQTPKRIVDPLSYYQPLFNLLLVKPYEIHPDFLTLLSYHEWVSFLLQCMHDFSLDSIAWVMRIKKSTVRTHLRRAREKLGCQHSSCGVIRLIAQAFLKNSPISASEREVKLDQNAAI